MSSTESLTKLAPRQFALLNAALSGAALAFLVWLIYFHEGQPSGAGSRLLPALSALFNACAAILLAFGLRAIRRGERRRHQQLMMGAFGASALFLINYIYYHSTAGDTPFPGQGLIRPVYFFILITHIVLSAIVLPMIFTSFYLALSDRLPAHRRFSRWTWAGWMYVSVTGVLIFFLLHVIDWSSAGA